MERDYGSFGERVLTLSGVKEGRTPGLSLAVSRKDNLIYSGAWGVRRAGGRNGEGSLPMEPDTLCRTASISKIIAALSAAVLEERGLFDLSRDLSDYLGYSLRNPRFPGQRISASHILTHTSSLRDGTAYNLPKAVPIRSLLEGEGSRVNWSGKYGPDRAVYDYCNLGYGVLATALERATGKNYHSLTRELILDPLLALPGGEAGSTGASFNLQSLTPADRENLAELYRRESPSRPWELQCDGADRVREIAGDASFYEGYEPGTNGTLFAPQGGLRASVLHLNLLGRLFLGRGTVSGVPILSEGVIDRVSAPCRVRRGGILRGKMSLARGLFPLADGLPRGKSPQLWGHHGDAYGLKGALCFDRERELTFAYLLTGTQGEEERGRWSERNLREESLTEEIIRTFWA